MKTNEDGRLGGRVELEGDRRRLEARLLRDRLEDVGPAEVAEDVGLVLADEQVELGAVLGMAEIPQASRAA